MFLASAAFNHINYIFMVQFTVNILPLKLNDVLLLNVCKGHIAISADPYHTLLGLLCLFRVRLYMQFTLYHLRLSAPYYIFSVNLKVNNLKMTFKCHRTLSIEQIAI